MSQKPLSRLEAIPRDILMCIEDFLPKESRAALSLTSKHMRHSIGWLYLDLSEQEKVSFLRLLERECEEIYCPWCKKLHDARKAPGDKLDSRYQCRGRSDFKGHAFDHEPFIPGHHPYIYYAYAKNVRLGRDVSQLKAMIELPIVGTLGVSGMVKTRAFSVLVNEYGVFWQKRDSYTTSGHCQMKNLVEHWMDFSAHIGLCRHLSPKTTLKSQEGQGRIVVRCRCPVPGHTGKCDERDVHWCDICRMDFLLETQVSGNGRDQLHFTTWIYLGPGDAANNIRYNHHHRPWAEEGKAGEVARYSGMPSALGTLPGNIRTNPGSL
ncbi:hypothetical protein JX266_012237 [Neoarthrinium moseri]|uniref:uncharacterized protein n=1 Tax=Neoarthrinium moseri TaxID=1658444 RepID=UPI001FDB5D82|nr:uncharacterized protein JN550_003812 [Neoarthrinium moseri]KAI1841584.1 hypothetical protein JX266_012237 [Neoarthrinium moseri]KAI1872938.1 hypothetical protein JN550_003812 [Neoarthrinium moseri]